MPDFTDIYSEGRPLKPPPLTRDQSVHALTATAHMLEAAAHLLMIGKDKPSRDLIAEANVVMEEVPSIDSLEK